MGDIAAEVKTFIKTVGGITALIGSGTAARIYTHEAKQGSAITPPYIILEIYQGSSEHHLGGISGKATNRVEIRCYETTAAKAYTLAELVRVNVDFHKGNMGSTWTEVISGDGYERGYDPPIKGANQKRYWISRDYMMMYDEATS